MLNLDQVAIDDPIQMYLREICRVPLLTAREEVELAKLIEQGKTAEIRLAQAWASWYDAIEANPLSTEERAQLAFDVERGKLAQRRLTEANFRLVVSIAKKYTGRGIPLLDLIQEGNIGLIRAVEKFDYRKGYRFSTYATWWIRQAVTRAIANQSRTIRLPVNKVETISKLNRTSGRLVQELGREPSSEEIAQEMGISAAKVREITRVSQGPVSLETLISDEENSYLRDFIEDRNMLAPSDAASLQLLREQVDDALDSLTNRERQILQLRYGLDGRRSRTLEEVSREFELTRERVRQIETEALHKLRRSSCSKQLQDYLE